MPQIKSKERVRDLAEVYTNEREVKAMLDLIPLKNEDEIIKYRYLEPACGNGNFLTEILARKLCRVNQKYGEKPLTVFEFNIIRSLSSIYGIDICTNNVLEAIERLYTQVKSFFDLHKGGYIPSTGFFETVRWILENNIVVGDSINKPGDIFFFEYQTKGKQFQRVKYCYVDLIENREPTKLEVLPYENYASIGLKLLGIKQLEMEL